MISIHHGEGRSLYYVYTKSEDWGVLATFHELEKAMEYIARERDGLPATAAANLNPDETRRLAFVIYLLKTGRMSDDVAAMRPVMTINAVAGALR